MSEEDVVNYLVENYVIDPTKPPLLSAADTNTAFDSESGFFEELDLLTQPGFDAEDNIIVDHWAAPELRPVREKVHELLNEGRDIRFCRLVDRLNEAVQVQDSVRSEKSLKQLLAILFLLSKEKKPISTETLAKRAEDNELWINSRFAANQIRRLQTIGVQFTADERLAATRFALDSEQSDPALRELIGRLKGQRYELDVEPDMLETLGRLIEERIPAERRLSRSELLSLFAAWYMLNEDPSFESVDAIERDFRQKADEVLESARFQPFSTRNVFDLYLLVMIVVYSSQDYLGI